jgi:hypothetical protein
MSSPMLYTDLGHDIMSEWRSANVDHGTNNWKLSAEISMKYRKGVA